MQYHSTAFRRETFFQVAYFLHTEVPANNKLWSQFQEKIHKHSKPRVFLKLTEQKYTKLTFYLHNIDLHNYSFAEPLI